MKSTLITLAVTLASAAALAAVSFAGLYAVELRSVKAVDEFRVRDIERVLVEHEKAKRDNADLAADK